MTTTRATSIPRSSQVQGGTPAYLPAFALRDRIKSVSTPLQIALAKVAELKRALASSQRRDHASRMRGDGLPKAAAKPVLECEMAHAPVPASIRLVPQLSLSTGLDPDELALAAQLATTRIRFKKGAALYRYGDRFGSLYAISAGSCKSSVLTPGGLEQVAGYHIVGDIVGLDGIGSNVHECQVLALEDTEACPLSFRRIDDLARISDQFRSNLLRLLSEECSRVKALAVVLANMRSEERLAVFLLDLSRRYKARGFSSCEFVLRMTRQEIGSYLGLKLETVSRLFSRFQHVGLIRVEGRTVRLLDRLMLKQLADNAR